MKSILISIRPEWVAKILNGEKTIEIRKTAPKCELPIDVYIYCTMGKAIKRKEFIDIKKSKENHCYYVKNLLTAGSSPSSRLGKWRKFFRNL